MVLSHGGNITVVATKNPKHSTQRHLTPLFHSVLLHVAYECVVDSCRIQTATLPAGKRTRLNINPNIARLGEGLSDTNRAPDPPTRAQRLPRRPFTVGSACIQKWGCYTPYLFSLTLGRLKLKRAPTAAAPNQYCPFPQLTQTEPSFRISAVQHRSPHKPSSRPRKKGARKQRQEKRPLTLHSLKKTTQKKKKKEDTARV